MHRTEVPAVRDVSAAFAQVMTGLMDRLTPAEQGEIVRLGALVKRRSSRLVPMLGWGEIDAHLERCASEDPYMRGLEILRRPPEASGERG